VQDSHPSPLTARRRTRQALSCLLQPAGRPRAVQLAHRHGPPPV